MLYITYTFTADCFPLKNHIFENDFFLLINRYVIKINLRNYFYLIFFGKNPSFRFKHGLNALEIFILKILTSVIKNTLIEFYNKYIQHIRNTISIEKDLDTLFGKQNDLFSTVLLTDAKSILTKLKTITQDQTNINDYPTWFLLTFQQQHCVFGRSSIPEHHAKIIGFDK
ncbi:unnamed protein product [Adineta steineri]|nr:unnamed protein product [Adineta steineri]